MGLKIRETPIKTYPHQKTFHLWRELYTNNYFTFTECYRPQSSLPESVIYTASENGHTGISLKVHLGQLNIVKYMHEQIASRL